MVLLNPSKGLSGQEREGGRKSGREGWLLTDYIILYNFPCFPGEGNMFKPFTYSPVLTPLSGTCTMHQSSNSS